MKDNFAEAYETPLGPGPEYRALVTPMIRPTGTWTDGVTWPGRLLGEALLLNVPQVIDGAARATDATYNSAVDALVEQAISGGLPRNNMEHLGRDIKAFPEAFLRAPGTIWPGTPPTPIRVIQQFSGQEHHGISSVVFRAAEKHPNLRGYYEYRDPRFVTQGVDLAAHNGWFGWHKDLDYEIANFIKQHPELTPRQFEAYLTLRYDEPDLATKFPNGLWKKKRIGP